MNKNPLYMVNGNNVEAVNGWMELLVKKLGLEPLMNLLKMLLEQVKSYQMLEQVNKVLSQLIEQTLLTLRTLGFQL
jgi:hypothetical protein